MASSITVTLSPEVKDALDDVARKDGVQADVVVGQAIKEHLFLRQFRLLRERMSAQAQSQGILTDQDVFDRVS
jgi:predicted transcriptional regulator